MSRRKSAAPTLPTITSTVTGKVTLDYSGGGLTTDVLQDWLDAVHAVAPDAGAPVTLREVTSPIRDERGYYLGYYLGESSTKGLAAIVTVSDSTETVSE